MRLDNLPPPPQPAGAYRPIMLVGDMAYLSGFGPRHADGTPLVGMVGRELDLAAAQAAARNIGETILSVLQGTLGDLDRVRQIVRIT
ncbi:MAG: RidA family protein, partial [Devosia sp.]